MPAAGRRFRILGPVNPWLHSSRLARCVWAQINVVVGDVEGNSPKILEWIGRARESRCGRYHVSRSGFDGLSARGPATQTAIHRRQSRRARESDRANSRHRGRCGGIDSALTATIAADALGAGNVVGVLMPSEFSSRGSVTDSEQLAKNLGIETLTIPINDVLQAFTTALRAGFKGAGLDVTEENIQARIRGTYLMALSNKFGWLVMSTGNKSELSTGYCTLYGDMAGGFGVLKDVMKTTVFRLAEHSNRAAGRERIPRAVIEKPPSAELRPNQLDTDSLPPYDVLDPILKAFVEEDRSFPEMLAMGFDEQLVRRVVRMVETNEYNRRQAAPGLKITLRAFACPRAAGSAPSTLICRVFPVLPRTWFKASREPARHLTYVYRIYIMNDAGYEWDDDKAERNEKDHDVSFHHSWRQRHPHHSRSPRRKR